jgi:streptogramin lyase
MEKKSALAALAGVATLLIGAPLFAQSFIEYPLPTGAGPRSVVLGPDGNLWFTEADAGKIGRITPDGSIAEFPLSSSGAEPWRIAAGPDGALWFTEMAGNRIGRISVSGVIDEFDVPTPKSLPRGIAAGPDGAKRTASAASRPRETSASSASPLIPDRTASRRPPTAPSGSRNSTRAARDV